MEERNPKRSEKQQFSSDEEDKKPVIKKVISKESKNDAFMKGKPKPTKIKDLQPGDEGINILAEVSLSLLRSFKLGTIFQSAKATYFALLGMIQE